MYMNLPMSVNTGYQLHIVRERVWSFVRGKCHSFESMDANAQFSEMFSTNVFGQLSYQQASALISVHYLSGQCNNRNHCVDSEVRFFFNLVTSSDLTRQDIPLFKWPDLLFHNNNKRTIQCTNCQETCGSNSSRSHLSEVLLIEFSSDAMNVLRSKKNLLLVNINFQLKAMVPKFAGHFTCALSENVAEKLEYLDDFCETSYY